MHVLYGSANGLSAARSQYWTQDTTGVQGRSERGDRFGVTLAAADFGSGHWADLAIGIPFEDVGRSEAAGAVTVLYGSADGLTAAGDQLWTQDSTGIRGTVEPPRTSSGDRSPRRTSTARAPPIWPSERPSSRWAARRPPVASMSSTAPLTDSPRRATSSGARRRPGSAATRTRKTSTATPSRPVISRAARTPTSRCRSSTSSMFAGRCRSSMARRAGCRLGVTNSGATDRPRFPNPYGIASSGTLWPSPTMGRTRPAVSTTTWRSEIAALGPRISMPVAFSCSTAPLGGSRPPITSPGIRTYEVSPAPVRSLTGSAAPSPAQTSATRPPVGTMPIWPSARPGKRSVGRERPAGSTSCTAPLAGSPPTMSRCGMRASWMAAWPRTRTSGTG